MSAKNPRLSVVLEPKLYRLVKAVASRDGLSLSLKARDLLQEALAFDEDAYWLEMARSRESTWDPKKAIPHEAFWKKAYRK